MPEPGVPSHRSGTTRLPSAGAANFDPRGDTPQRSWRRVRMPPEKHGWRFHRGLQQGSSRTNGGPFRLPSVFRGRRATDPTRSREVLRSFRIVKVWFLVVHVLSVSSLKGGVGKTTVTLGLASAAFAKGLRTLVVDLDPQSDVSTGMDINVAGHLNVADVLASPKEKIVRAAIAPSGWTKGRPGKIDVMIGSPSAINFDGPHPSIRDIWKLEEALANVEKDYDLVLIDCAPSLNALTRTAWAASDRVDRKSVVEGEGGGVG